MENIIAFIKTLSVASVILAALWLISPKGRFEKHFKYAISIFMLAVIITKAGDITFDFENDFSASTPTFATAQSITDASTEYIIEKLLTDCNIKFNQITVFTDKSDFSDINITKAKIRLENNADFHRAAEIIKNQTGITVICD